MDCYTTTTGTFETRYAEQGAGHPLLLLHGWGAGLRIWRHVWPQAVPRFRAMAPDLPGWGGSDKPEDAPYAPDWYAEWIGQFLDARFAPQATLVAHSMGTMAAVAFAARHPQRVRRLVLCNPPVDGRTAFSSRTYLLVKPVLRTLMYWLSRTRAVRRWIARDFTCLVPWDDEDIDTLGQASYEALIRSVLGMIRTDMRLALTGLRMPVLLVTSARDAVVGPDQAPLARRALPHARHVEMADVGHCPMLERPEEFNRVVLDFAAEGLPRTRPPGW